MGGEQNAEVARRFGHAVAAEPNEKIVIFATHLGTVDMIAARDRADLPRPGRKPCCAGGDHGAKVAAERRFPCLKGRPTRWFCTAAGRENQPPVRSRLVQLRPAVEPGWAAWSNASAHPPRWLVSRDTAQVYNLDAVGHHRGAAFFLLLDEKLTEIARTVGKVDDQGNVARRPARADSGRCRNG